MGGDIVKKVDEAEGQAMLRRRKKILMTATALGVIGVSTYGWWQKTIPPDVSAVSPRGEIVEAARRTPAEVVVYVSGQVKHPGLLKVAAGARVLDAVNAAGGLLQGADVSKVNLAQAVRDGMQIHVVGQPSLPSDSGAVRTTTSQSSTPEGKININTADAAELDRLPGVGPSLAARIVEYRKTNGFFHDGPDLKKVTGIGEVKYQQLKDKISW